MENRSNEYIDPICGMTVTPETAAAKVEYNGETVYFCAAVCKEKFLSRQQTAPIQIGRDKPQTPKAEIDPVCGMTVDPENAAGSFEFENNLYYFCAQNCLTKFRQNPNLYLSENKKDTHEPANEGTEYTCPMHPEIIRIGPGSCPICGMALEPKIISLEDRPDPEFVDMKRRFWISAILTIPVFTLAMSEMLPNFHQYISPKTSVWIQLLLSAPVVTWGGFPFFGRALASIRNVSPNMFTLIAMGTGAAFIYSLCALFLPQLFPESMLDPGIRILFPYISKLLL
ncbi:MAG: YHS domain-containing protein [Pyrinomonadaceae bacterium]